MRPSPTSTHHPPARALQGPCHSPAVVLALSAPRSHISRQEPTRAQGLNLTNDTLPHVRWSPTFQPAWSLDSAFCVPHPHRDGCLQVHAHVLSRLDMSRLHVPYPPPSALDGGGLGRPLDHDRLPFRHASPTRQSAVRNSRTRALHTCHLLPSADLPAVLTCVHSPAWHIPFPDRRALLLLNSRSPMWACVCLVDAASYASKSWPTSTRAATAPAATVAATRAHLAPATRRTLDGRTVGRPTPDAASGARRSDARHSDAPTHGTTAARDTRSVVRHAPYDTHCARRTARDAAPCETHRARGASARRARSRRAAHDSSRCLSARHAHLSRGMLSLHV